MALTDKQQRFVAEYRIDLNAAAAARRAGFSEKTAAELGYKLLGKPAVADAIAAAMKARSERTGITADRVLEETARLALADITDAVQWGDAVAVTPEAGGDPVSVQGVVLVP